MYFYNVKLLSLIKNKNKRQKKAIAGLEPSTFGSEG